MRCRGRRVLNIVDVYGLSLCRAWCARSIRAPDFQISYYGKGGRNAYGIDINTHISGVNVWGDVIIFHACGCGCCAVSVNPFRPVHVVGGCFNCKSICEIRRRGPAMPVDRNSADAFGAAKVNLYPGWQCKMAHAVLGLASFTYNGSKGGS